MLSVPSFLQSPWRQLGEARPSKWPLVLLCLVLPLEGKQYSIRNMLLLGVTVLVPTVLSGLMLGALLILALSVLTAYLWHLQNRGCRSLSAECMKYQDTYKGSRRKLSFQSGTRQGTKGILPGP